MARPQVGIQLYSVRDRCERDFLGTIREMAEIGYAIVEFAGFYGASVREVREALDTAGIGAVSAHIGLNLRKGEPVDVAAVREHVRRQAAFAAELGLKFFIVPSYPLPDDPTEDDVARMAEALEAAGEAAREAGLAFGYHNHASEFRMLNGKTVMDRLLERMPSLIAQFDLGWVKVGGGDPAEYVRRYAGRVPLVHAKDFKADGTDAELGRGVVDWDSALEACLAAGVEYVIVEQEEYEASSLESAKRNFAWFRQRGWV